MGNFNFFENTNNITNSSGLLADIFLTNEDTFELFHELKEKLYFPEYFGYNWDALFDFLSDFSWLVEEKIFIIHHSIPIANETEFKIYLKVLSDTLIFWANEDKDFLQVYFPLKTKDTIESLIM